MPRPRKTKAEVRVSRKAASHARWDALTPEQRSLAVAPAVAASPANKKRAQPSQPKPL